MARDKLKQHATDELRNIREKLLSINKQNLRFHDIWKILNGSGALQRADTLMSGLPVTTSLYLLMDGYATETDVDILDEKRTEVIELIDTTMLNIDQSIKVRPILEEYILKVKDHKLSELLKEFNRIKDGNPNLAAIGFRTILCLVIREKASIKAPTLPLASKDDLKFDEDIKSAIDNHIFSSGEERQLVIYRDGGNKGIFNNVAHKAGGNMLISKEYLEDAVDLLNVLLPSIV